MKVKVAEWRKLFKEIDDAISHSRKEGLPLQSIELNPAEWELFIDSFKHSRVARSKLNNPPGQLEKGAASGEIHYMQTKIYRGAS